METVCNTLTEYPDDAGRDAVADNSDIGCSVWLNVLPSFKHWRILFCINIFKIESVIKRVWQFFCGTASNSFKSIAKATDFGRWSFWKWTRLKPHLLTESSYWWLLYFNQKNKISLTLSFTDCKSFKKNLPLHSSLKTIQTSEFLNCNIV